MTTTQTQELTQIELDRYLRDCVEGLGWAVESYRDAVRIQFARSYEATPENNLYRSRLVAAKHDMQAEVWYRLSCAIPTQRAIDLIASFKDIIEVGAGSGYWARLIADAGAQVLALDKSPRDDSHFDVQKGGVARCQSEKHKEKTLLLCWPPPANPMAFNALKFYKGKRVIFVGQMDNAHGCDYFHRRLKSEYRLVRVQWIPTWWQFSDHVYVYER